MPQAKFAGPDISNKLPYLTAFAQEAPKHPDVVLLTSHYYAMGPASSPDAADMMTSYRTPHDRVTARRMIALAWRALQASPGHLDRP